MEGIEMPRKAHYTLWNTPRHLWTIINVNITPGVVEAVEQALSKPLTPKQKKVWTERLRAFQGHCLMWRKGLGWVRS